MNGEPARKSHAMAWTFFVIVLLILYALSWGPAMYIDEREPGELAANDSMHVFYWPIDWLHDNTPLKKPLDDYLVWNWNQAL